MVILPAYRNEHLNRRKARSIRLHPAEYKRLLDKAKDAGYTGSNDAEIIEAYVMTELDIEPVRVSELITEQFGDL